MTQRAMFTTDVTGLGPYSGFIDVDYYDRESRTWQPLTTVRGRAAAQTAIEEAIRAARASGGFDLSPAHFRCLLAKDGDA